jgi:hypothetical protein
VPGLGLGCTHDSHQVRPSLEMDIPALRQGQGLVAVRLGAGKGADLVEEAAEACSRAERVEPPCHEVGPIREVPQVGGLHHHDERRAA